MAAILVVLMVAVLGAEYPSGLVPDERRAEVAELAPLFLKHGAEGRLVSPEVDPHILAAVSFFEARWRARGPDGDCYMTRGAYPRKVCTSIGPMQISTGAIHCLPRLHKRWRGLTAQKLRKPDVNVRAGYDGLVFWHTTCGGSVAKALSAYRLGRCPTTLGYSARARCALAVSMSRALGAPEWKCGHESVFMGSHARMLDWATRRVKGKLDEMRAAAVPSR